tara:strand:+ start:444 stop:989 length:546 start_codon:yes stop_codon:yes gene_type:complete
MTEIEREVNELRQKLELSHKFAKKLPYFEDIILGGKYSGSEPHIKLGSKYKKIPLNWGINRNHYKTDSRVTITNYDYEVGMPYDQHLFSIYINCSSLFDTTERFGLAEAVANCPVFFFDKLNTTFYATDEQLVPLLEALNDWYINAISELHVYRAKKRVILAEKELERAKENLIKAEEKRK